MKIELMMDVTEAVRKYQGFYPPNKAFTNNTPITASFVLGIMVARADSNLNFRYATGRHEYRRDGKTDSYRLYLITDNVEFANAFKTMWEVKEEEQE